MSEGGNDMRISIWIAVGVTVCLGLSSAIIIGTTRSTARTAHEFLVDVQRGDVGMPPAATIRALRERYPTAMADHARSIGVVGDSCRTDECDMAFLFDNRWLRRLHLAPPVWMRARVGIHKGLLSYRNIEFGAGDLAFSEASVSEQMEQAEGGQPYAVGRLWSGGPWREHIAMTPAATEQQRRQAFGFNVECLSKFGGCHDAADLLPTVPWGAPPGDPQFSGNK
jgi:hypothetical protein